jgi:hypothetical protein
MLPADSLPDQPAQDAKSVNRRPVSDPDIPSSFRKKTTA